MREHEGSSPSGSTICGRGGMADAPDLGSGVFDIRVQVPSPAPFFWSDINETLVSKTLQVMLLVSEDYSSRP